VLEPALPTPPAPPPPPVPVVAEGRVDSLAALEADRARIQAALNKAGEGAKLEITWKVTRK
jgi:hypothetical protein